MFLFIYSALLHFPTEVLGLRLLGAWRLALGLAAFAAKVPQRHPVLRRSILLLPEVEELITHGILELVEVARRVLAVLRAGRRRQEVV